MSGTSSPGAQRRIVETERVGAGWRLGFATLVATLLVALAVQQPALARQTEEPDTELPSEPYDRGNLRILIFGPRTLVAPPDRVSVIGASPAKEGSQVEVTIAERTETTTIDKHGRFEVRWPENIEPGVYPVEVVVTESAERQGRARTLLAVRDGRVPLRPMQIGAVEYGEAPRPAEEDFEAFTDRWRISPPPYELTVQGSKWDPYNQNKLKGDSPIIGQDIFLNITGISDTLIDASAIPIPSNVGSSRPGRNEFFGQPSLLVGQQNYLFSADLFKGQTAFKPVEWRVRATLVGNTNYLESEETGVVKPDVSRAITRTDGRGSVQELFFEWKIANLSVNYDFLSFRIGVQQFNSDFRGFIFNDENLGFRLFGSTASNRNQFNLAYFDRLEKDTNSGLNTFEMRDQQVAIANFYRQDIFGIEGYNWQWSLHYLRDEPTFFFDKNGRLARPDPVGDFTPHEIKATYVGWTGFGHIRRLNLDHAVYYVFGDDSLNPIAGRDPETGEEEVDISAFLVAAEFSYDRNWFRPSVFFQYASGDDEIQDRDAEGFDAIFDNPNFAGGGFSYWNRLGIPLTGTLTSLTTRGSFLNSLKTSREEGQPNFVNPGLVQVGAGIEIEVLPKVTTLFNGSYLRFDTTETLQALLFQETVGEEIGFDLSAGLIYRPFLNNQFVILGGIAGLLPGEGFRDIYESGQALYGTFVQLTLRW
ncbi:MAG TPA: hypothetical protein VMV46_21500 [Thermoanaerobaculia bacterium]|nr:hypothetical protein [Thermoanaerobaculia bacterium]